MRLDLDVRDPVDLPTNSAKASIAALVALGIQPTSMPRDVVDLQSPADVGKSSVGVDRHSIREPDRMLVYETDNAMIGECLEDSKLEP